MFVLALLPLTNNCRVGLVGTRDPNPSMKGLLPGIRSATGVLCGVCVTLAITLVVLLLLKKVPLCSDLYTTFKATKANKFKVGSSDVKDCDLCVRVIVAVFVVLFNMGFGICFLLLAEGFSRTLGSRRIHYCFFIVVTSTLVVAFGIQRLFSGI